MLSQCKLFIENSTFSENFALNQGGAIKWDYYEPEMKNVRFSNNSAGLMGPDISGVAKRVVQIEEKDLGKSKLDLSFTRNIAAKDVKSIEAV